MAHRKFLAAVTGLFALVGSSAYAADMPVKSYPPITPAPVFTWTGFYVGVNLGGAWTNNDSNFVTFDGVPITFGGNGGSNNNGGVIGGGQVGYNWQFNNILLGVEGDFQGSSQKRSNTFTDVDFGNFNTEARIQWFATARGRLGYVNGPWLIYATGGGAWVNFKGSIDNAFFGSFSSETTRSGWTVGGGVEWMFLPRWSAKLEYLFIDVGDNSFNDGFGNRFDVRLQENVVRAGVNYHF